MDRSKTSEGPEWITVPEAAEITGVSISRLLTWCREGLIASEVAETAEGSLRMVRANEAIARTEREGVDSVAPQPRPRAGSTELQTIITALPGIIRELGDARERAARAEMKVEFLSQQLKALRDGPAPASPRFSPIASPSETRLERGESGSRGEDLGDIFSSEAETLPPIPRDRGAVDDASFQDRETLHDLWDETEIQETSVPNPTDVNDDGPSPEPRSSSRRRRKRFGRSS
jgi:hypothetical protein